MDGCIREAVVMEEAHLLAEQAVDDVSPRILPLNKADQLAVQRGTQIHGPVIAVQIHLTHREGDMTVKLISSQKGSLSTKYICTICSYELNDSG